MSKIEDIINEIEKIDRELIPLINKRIWTAKENKIVKVLVKKQKQLIGTACGDVLTPSSLMKLINKMIDIKLSERR